MFELEHGYVRSRHKAFEHLGDAHFFQCWIDEKYAFERLWLHYFWIFIAMFGTIMLYAIIYSTLNTRLRPESIASTSSLAPLSSRASAPEPRTINRAARYMIIYPTIYVLCTLPLAAGRMAAMTGHLIPYWFYCVAGAAITSCGWLDVLLYAFTRCVLVFSDAPPPIDECGLETFGIFHSPEKFWSVRTTVEGGVLVDSTVSTRRRKQYKENASFGSRPDLRSQDGVLDDTFDLAMPGTITTKTTITITTEPRTTATGESADELTDSTVRPVGKPDHIPSQRSSANTTTDDDSIKSN